MKRVLLLTGLIAIGGLSIAAAGFQAPQGRGDGRGRGPQGPPVAQIEKVKDDLYEITGGGGNTAAFITERGVVLVDTKLAGWGQAILDKVKTVTDKPVVEIINTHTHGDHNGSNEYWHPSIEIVAHANTKANMEKMDAFKGAKASYLPKHTFTDRLDIGSGKELIELYYFGAAHTNGDAWVLFKADRVLHAGDAFAGLGAPLIDGNNGGSAVEYGKTLEKAFKGIKGVDSIITGHANKLMTMADLKTFADYNNDFVEWVKTEIKAGKTSDQATMEYKVPERFAAKGVTASTTGLFGGIKGNIETAYKELGK
jgi:glyoxylase-like metal-dependent hydrolase (beta-lactamase superfamily II)